jgi:hypothetical protein
MSPRIGPPGSLPNNHSGASATGGSEESAATVNADAPSNVASAIALHSDGIDPAAPAGRLPQAGNGGQPGSEDAPVAVQPSTSSLGVRFGGEAEFLVQYNSLMAMMDGCLASLPDAIQAGVGQAMRTSTERIRKAYEQERITGPEAAQALEMMREMHEALTDVHTGAAEIQKSIQTGHVHVWNVKAADGDEYVITARTLRDARGDPRIGFRHMVDDGQKLPSRHRMGLRIDLEKWGDASVDVQFGSSSLDKRVHGLMKDETGAVFTTDSGKKLADHHFRDDLPDSIRSPQNFAAMVQAFIDGEMVLPQAAPVAGTNP